MVKLMNNIIDIEKLIEEEIDTNNYIESLLNLSIKYKYITDEQRDNIIYKFLMIISKTIKLYTGQLTSSVPISLFKNISNSNMYIVSLYLKDKRIKEQINILISESADNIYNQSIKFLEEYINKTKLFYNVIFINNIVPINNYFYNSTLKDGIKSFFKLYNFYDAKNIIITADYECLIGRPNLFGIEFINKYLEYINYENIFLRKFNYIKQENLLKKLYSNYEDLPINIFEIIFTFCLVLEYLNKDIYDLNILDIDVEKIYNDDNYINNLDKAYNNLKNKWKFDDKTNKYLDKCKVIIINKIIYHYKNNTLHILLGEKESRVINYIVNPKMCDKKYNDLIVSLKEVHDNERINIIKENINSLFDIVDIISDIDFNDTELFSLFSSLNIIEIMVLKNYFKDMEDSYIFKILNRYIMTKNIKEQNIINENYIYIEILVK